MFYNVRMNVCEHYVKKRCSIILRIIWLYQLLFQDHIQIHLYHQLFLLLHLRLIRLLTIFNWILQYTILLNFVLVFFPLKSLLLCFFFFFAISVVMPYNLFVIIYFLLTRHAFTLFFFFISLPSVLFFTILCEYVPFLFEPNVCTHAEAASRHVHVLFHIFLPFFFALFY